MLHNPQVVLLLAGLVAGCSAVFALRASRESKRKVKQQEAWPAFVDGFASALTSGLGRVEALEVAISRCPVILKPGFETVSTALQRKRAQDALSTLKDSFESASVDEFAELMIINERLGGAGTALVLKTHAQRCRDKSAADAMARSKTTSTLTIAKLGVTAPWVLLLLLISRPESAESFETPAGLSILLGGLATCVVAYRLIVLLGRMPSEVRVYGKEN